MREDGKIKGDFAWVAMALGILAYDVTAISTGKAETMSTALWRSLSHPAKFLISSLAWGITTYHLFGSLKARDSVKTLYENKNFKVIKRDKYFYE